VGEGTGLVMNCIVLDSFKNGYHSTSFTVDDDDDGVYVPVLVFGNFCCS
jgi:hypothetical protein